MPAVILRHAFIPPDNARLAHLCGSLDEHLRSIEAALDVSIHRRNESFRVEGGKRQAERAVALQGMGIDSVYVHWGSDQRVEMPERDPQVDLAPVLDAVSIPVGVGTFSSEEGERAVRRGASIVAIGMPLIKSGNPYEALKEYVDRAKSV